MRYVNRPIARPNVCAIIPSRGASGDDVWIDTGNELTGWDPHIYLSGAGARKVAQFLGWTSPEDRAQLDAELERLHEELAAAERDLSDLETCFEAIDALESRDLRARKKAGRPSPKKQELVNG